MKSFKKIAILVVVVTSIIVFWLAPGINTAKDTEYTRLYEDTDHHPKFASSDTTDRKKLNRLEIKRSIRQRRAYKKESIRSTDKLSKIKPSMFSRAIQFEERLVNDSVKIVGSANTDTTRIVQ